MKSNIFKLTLLLEGKFEVGPEYYTNETPEQRAQIEKGLIEKDLKEFLNKLWGRSDSSSIWDFINVEPVLEDTDGKCLEDLDRKGSSTTPEVATR